MHFYGVPKIGSIIAYRFNIDHYANAESFNDGLDKLKAYREEMATFNKQIEDERQEYKTRLEEYER